MPFIQKDGLTIWEFVSFGRSDGVLCAVSTRKTDDTAAGSGDLNLGFSGGDTHMKVSENRQCFLGALGIDEGSLAIPGQIHSATVKVARKPGTYPKTDGLVTNEKAICLVISTADCLPVFLHDPVNGVVGAVHSGRRGTAAQIIMRAVKMMQEEFGSDPKEISAAAGPYIGGECYEVGSEVAAEFDARYTKPISSGKYLLDIWKAVKDQLLGSGMKSDKIENPRLCTVCRNDLFFSHRKEKDLSGRMWGVIRRA